jgi:hypothetical protein
MTVKRIEVNNRGLPKHNPYFLLVKVSKKGFQSITISLESRNLQLNAVIIFAYYYI